MQAPIAIPRALPRPLGPRWTLPLAALLLAIVAISAYLLLTSTRTGVQGTRVAVQRGTVSQTVTTNGTTVSDRQAKLSFLSSGRVKEVFAKLGDSVVSGQPIASLDARQFEIKLENARSSLRTAELKVRQLQEGATEEEIAAAQAVVDQAASKLAQAQAGGRPEEVAATQAVVDQAAAKLAQAQAGGRVEEIAAARAQANQAQARAAQVAAGARSEEVAGLQAGIDTAEAQQDQIRAQLTAAQAALAESLYRLEQARSGQGGPGVRPEDITQAEATLETNRAKLAQVKYPRAEDIRAAELAVAKARSDLQTAEGNRDSCGEARTTTNSRSTDRSPAGTTRTTTRSTARTSCPSAQQEALDAQVEAARVNVQIAENNLGKIKSPSPYDIQQAEQAVTLAEANLQKLKFGGSADVASLGLKVTQAQTEVDRLQASLDQSTSTVAAAQAKLDAAVNPDLADVRQALEAANQARANLAKIANPDPYVVQGASASLGQAEANLAKAMAPDPHDVQNAQASLAWAQAEFQNTIRAPKETDLALAMEQVELARLNVRQAELDLEYAMLTAPFDGIVAAINVHAGEQVTGTSMAQPGTQPTALVTLVDPRDVRVEANIDEVDIGKLAVGKPAEVVFDALPDRTFLGQVAAISPSGTNQQGVVKYLVSVNLEMPPDVTLPAGLTTSLIIQKQNALLVPRSAVRRQGREQVVDVLVGDRLDTRTVRTGLAGDQLIEVVDGLHEGDLVVLPGSGTTAPRANQYAR